MTERPSGVGQRLSVLEAEIARWNQQINLVTRVNTRATLKSLIDQCQQGWALVNGALGEIGGYEKSVYIDLGSGSGLPGLVWAAERHGVGRDSLNILVEPRDKRAWFLQRAARAMGLDQVAVVAARWGEQVVPGIPAVPAAVLVSMKALHLEDAEVLAGIKAALPGVTPPRIAVCRFLEPAQRSHEWLEERFVAGGGVAGWRLEGAVVLGGDNPRLLLTRYSEEHPSR
jgi:hypothetical protein